MALGERTRVKDPRILLLTYSPLQPTRSLTDFRADETATQRYVAQYLGAEDRRSSERVLAELERKVVDVS
jgi:hypothetical protein